MLLNPSPPITQNISLKRKIYKAVLWLRKHVVVNSRESSREKNWCNILKRSKWHVPKIMFLAQIWSRLTRKSNITGRMTSRKSIDRNRIWKKIAAQGDPTRHWSLIDDVSETWSRFKFDFWAVSSGFGSTVKAFNFPASKSAQILTQTVWDRP